MIKELIPIASPSTGLSSVVMLIVESLNSPLQDGDSSHLSPAMIFACIYMVHQERSIEENFCHPMFVSHIEPPAEA